MSDNGNNGDSNNNDNPKSIEKFSEEEKKDIIEKMKKYLAAEDGDKVILYAALAKQLL